MSSMRVFKRRWRRQDGVVVESDNYHGEYKLEGDRQGKRVALHVRDKRVAEFKLREIVQHAERERAGLVLPAREVAAAQRPLPDHLSEFLADQKARGHNRGYILQLRARNRKLMVECGWQFVRDVTSGSFISWRSRQHNKSAATLNHYLQAIHTFMTWLKDQDMIGMNPLEKVKRVDQRGKQTFKRRHISSEEFERLYLASDVRGVVYLAAVCTGFRRGALYRLRWSDVVLDGPNPTVTLRTSDAKNRTPQILPLHPDLVLDLRRIKPNGVKPSERVFKGRLGREKLDPFKGDLKRAGIAFENDYGRFDFHALRHTAATWAGATGVAGPLLQSFTGHKTASQVARYVHVESLPTREIVMNMPRFTNIVNRPEYRPELTVQSTVHKDLQRPNVELFGTNSELKPLRKALENKADMHDLADRDTTCHEREMESHLGDLNPAKIAVSGSKQGNRPEYRPSVLLREVIHAWHRLSLRQQIDILAIVRQSHDAEPIGGVLSRVLNELTSSESMRALRGTRSGRPERSEGPQRERATRATAKPEQQARKAEVSEPQATRANVGRLTAKHPSNP